MGRPTKLSPVAREQILASLRGGSPRGLAARYAGLGEATFYRWLSDPRPAFREFREAVERAEAEAEHAAVAAVRSAMTRHWRAAAWWLERRRPMSWGINRQVELAQDGLTYATAVDRLEPESWLNRQFAVGLIRIAPQVVAASGLGHVVASANQTPTSRSRKCLDRRPTRDGSAGSNA